MISFSRVRGVCVLACACALLPVVAVQAQEFLNLRTEIHTQPAEGINTKHLEYAPAYYGSGIVFVHARDNDQAVDRKIGMPFFELMYAELRPDGLPGKATNFSPNIRTRFHEGPAAFSTDLNQIYFTRTNMVNGQNVRGPDDRTTMNIYLADKGPDDWENIRQLPFCSDSFSVMSPALSPDNMQLIFMSDMPGGHGGWDLYLSDKYSGTWSKPVNLGPTINTPKNEALPFWHAKDILFFASDGHPGEGKLDLFAAHRRGDGSFSAPLNLGPKFNSRHDDLTFICDQEGMTGFFASSRREGLGKDDIYFFRADESIFQPWLTEEPLLIEMMLAVRDKQNMEPVPGVSVWTFEIGASGMEGTSEVFETEIIDSSGDESIIIRMKPATELDPENPHHLSDLHGVIPVRLDPEKDYLVVLQSGAHKTREVILAKESIGAGNTYAFDLEPLDVASSASKGKNCIQTGAMVIAGSSYRPLSNVLVQVRNTCNGTNLVIDTDVEGRFRTCLEPGCEYEITFNKQGYIEERYVTQPGLDPEEKVVYLSEADLTERTGRDPEPGDVLVLNHIYYDFNKSAIRTGDARELTSLSEMMLKYPSMTIELESHTDSRGTEDYNLELSQRRGESAKEFLISRGIAVDRVTLKPMGESRLRNHCTDEVICSEAQHQQNRRTEIRIITVNPNLEVKYSDQQE